MDGNDQWHLADVYETIAGAVPERDAIIYGDRTVSWGSFDRRANAFGHALQASGLGPGSKVAVYVPNRPE